MQIQLGRGEAERRKFANILQYEDQWFEVFQFARECTKENCDAKCVCMGDGSPAVSDSAKKEA